MLIAAGLLWYRVAPRYHEHVRRFWRIENDRIRRAQHDNRHIGAVFLIGMGAFALAAVVLHALMALKNWIG